MVSANCRLILFAGLYRCRKFGRGIGDELIDDTLGGVDDRRDATQRALRSRTRNRS